MTRWVDMYIACVYMVLARNPEWFRVSRGTQSRPKPRDARAAWLPGGRAFSDARIEQVRLRIYDAARVCSERP